MHVFQIRISPAIYESWVHSIYIQYKLYEWNKFWRLWYVMDSSQAATAFRNDLH